MDLEKTALILIGFQKDYFSSEGILHDVIKSSSESVLSNTIEIIRSLQPTPALIISTPILFTPDYSELIEPVGILKTIRDAGAFKQGSPGSETIDQLSAFVDRIQVVEGKRGLNAFHDTRLEELLKKHVIKHVVLAGVVTSICIDSTARSAFEAGFQVTILSDCTCGRTDYEQDFYCKEIFPLYANVIDSKQFLGSISEASYD